MAKLFLQNDIRTIDALTIERQNITSVALMERAASTVTHWIMQHFEATKIVVLAGPGNNGGDGLVVARQLAMVGCMVEVFSFTNSNNHRSADCEYNWNRLPANVIKHQNEPLKLQSDTSLIVDALFGTGLSRPLEGLIAETIKLINSNNIPILSIDMPSGMGNEHSMTQLKPDIVVVKAKWTISFQFPKINFLMPEASAYVGQIVVTDIGLDKDAMHNISSNYFLTDIDFIRSIKKTRSKFAHKGNVGKALLMVGSKGMMGAAQLCARGCLRSGVGLLTALVPECGYQIMQIGVPEAMTLTCGQSFFGQDLLMPQLPMADAIGIGPGLGRAEQTTSFVLNIVKNTSIPLVVDADALWHLAAQIETFRATQPMIFTPHEGEFDRLTEKHQNRMARIETAQKFATIHNVVLVLKGAHTVVCTPNGDVFFNSTGNAGMATGGSGDVLTGILTGLLAQGYTATEAAILGVFLHGLAGDKAKIQNGEEALIATDIVNNISNAWNEIKKIE